MLGPCFDFQYSVYPIQFCDHLAGEETAGCFTFVVL